MYGRVASWGIPLPRLGRDGDAFLEPYLCAQRKTEILVLRRGCCLHAHQFGLHPFIQGCTPGFAQHTDSPRVSTHLGPNENPQQIEVLSLLLGPRTGKGTRWQGLSTNLLLWHSLILATPFSLWKPRAASL